MVWERRTPHPMLDVTFFSNARFSAASLGVMLGCFAMFGSLFLMSQLLQFVLGYSALDAGVRLLPFALSMAVLDRQHQARRPVRDQARRRGRDGPLAIGLLWMAIPGSGSTYAEYLPGMLLMGTGLALTWAPTT